MFRFEYDRVVGYHPYRTHQPWDIGGIRLLHVDGVNCGTEVSETFRVLLRDLEQRLLRDALDAGFRDACPDVHYGYTVVSEGSCGGDPDVHYQLRFSDGSLYVWLVPGPKEVP